MKRGTTRHPKMLALAQALKIHLAQAIGHIHALWEFAWEFAKPGDIGRYPNQAIARGALWDGDADAFVEALVATRWLDESAEHRLLIHDWSEHAEYSVSKFLLENKLRFADGRKPRAGLKSHTTNRRRVATSSNKTLPVANTVAVAVPSPVPEPSLKQRSVQARSARSGSQRASSNGKTPEQEDLEGSIYRVKLFNIFDDGKNLSFSDRALEVVREAAGLLFDRRGFKELAGARLDPMRETAWNLLRPQLRKIEAADNRRELLVARAVECARVAGEIESKRKGAA